MKSFDYVISDELGIHARPAGLLCKLVKSFNSKVTIEKGEKCVDASRIIALMGMGIKKNDSIKITVSGEDEEKAAAELEAFFKENL